MGPLHDPPRTHSAQGDARGARRPHGMLGPQGRLGGVPAPDGRSRSTRCRAASFRRRHRGCLGLMSYAALDPGGVLHHAAQLPATRDPQAQPAPASADAITRFRSHILRRLHARRRGREALNRRPDLASKLSRTGLRTFRSHLVACHKDSPATTAPWLGVGLRIRLQHSDGRDESRRDLRRDPVFSTSATRGGSLASRRRPLVPSVPSVPSAPSAHSGRVGRVGERVCANQPGVGSQPPEPRGDRPATPPLRRARVPVLSRV